MSEYVPIYSFGRDTAEFIYSRAFCGTFSSISCPQITGGCGKFSPHHVKCAHIPDVGCKFHPLKRLPQENGVQPKPKELAFTPSSLQKKIAKEKARVEKYNEFYLPEVVCHPRDQTKDLQQYSTDWDTAMKVARHIAELMPREAKFTDLGAGHGALSAALMTFGYSGVAIEVDSLAYCKLSTLATGLHGDDWDLLPFGCLGPSLETINRSINNCTVFNDFVIMNPPFYSMRDFLKKAMQSSDIIFLLAKNDPQTALYIDMFCLQRRYGVLVLNTFDLPLDETREWHSKKGTVLSTHLYLLFNRDVRYNAGDIKVPFQKMPLSRTECIYKEPDTGDYILQCDKSAKADILAGAVSVPDLLSKIYKCPGDVEPPAPEEIRILLPRAWGVYHPDFPNVSANSPNRYNGLFDSQAILARDLKNREIETGLVAQIAWRKDGHYHVGYGVDACDNQGKNTESVIALIVTTPYKPVIVPELKDLHDCTSDDYDTVHLEGGGEIFRPNAFPYPGKHHPARLVPDITAIKGQITYHGILADITILQDHELGGIEKVESVMSLHGPRYPVYQNSVQRRVRSECIMSKEDVRAFHTVDGIFVPTVSNDTYHEEDDDLTWL